MSYQVTNWLRVEWHAVPSYDVQPKDDCRIYWGSHGCDLPRGHRGKHLCLESEDGLCSDGYGWGTGFYGEDAPRFQPLHLLWQVLHPYHTWPHRWWMVYAFWDR